MRARRPQRVQIERPRFLQQRRRRRRRVEERWDERLARVIVERHFWVYIDFGVRVSDSLSLSLSQMGMVLQDAFPSFARFLFYSAFLGEFALLCLVDLRHWSFPGRIRPPVIS
jgi:hypothetical protein